MTDKQQPDSNAAEDPDRPLDEPPPSSVSWVSFAILLAVLSFGMYYYQRYRGSQRRERRWKPEPARAIEPPGASTPAPDMPDAMRPGN